MSTTRDCNHPRSIPCNSLGRIKLIPGLSLAALKSNLDREISLWYCLRAINSWGSGVLDLETALVALVDRFRYSKSAVYRILKAGDGVFWAKRKNNRTGAVRIEIFSLRRVAEHIDAKCGRHFVEVSAEDFVGDGKHRVATQRAWLYASFHKPRGNKVMPISRDSIQEVTGVNKRTQQRYDKIAVQRVPNFVDKQERGVTVPVLETVDGKSRQWVVHKQLGNSYTVKAERSARGMLGKVNATVQSFVGDEACDRRRFFASGRAYAACKSRFADCFLAVPQHSRCTRGLAGEWYRL